jgi:hypothetical protein
MYDMMGLHGQAILYTILYNHSMLQASCQVQTLIYRSCYIHLLCSPITTSHRIQTLRGGVGGQDERTILSQ